MQTSSDCVDLPPEFIGLFSNCPLDARRTCCPSKSRDSARLASASPIPGPTAEFDRLSRGKIENPSSTEKLFRLRYRSGKLCLRDVQARRSHFQQGFRATLVGLGASLVVIIGIYAGSRQFKDFDVALVPYAAATVFAAFALGQRYAVWMARPPTARLFQRIVDLLFTRGTITTRWISLLRGSFRTVGTQRFIYQRSPIRWMAHFCLMWGCLLAFGITFPLSFGWIRFETARNSQDVYEAFVFGIRVFQTNLSSPLASLVFNALVVSAVLVIAGALLSLYRRGRDRGILAVQDAATDLLPLLLLFAISATGLLLTISTHFMNGYRYDFLSQTHAVTVILLLVYAPYGKLFHIFQRPTQLGVHVYREAGASSAQASCIRCGEPFASAMQIEDLKRIEEGIGVRYGLREGKHYQDICPACRRKNLALLQDGLVRAHRRHEKLDAQDERQDG